MNHQNTATTCKTILLFLLSFVLAVKTTEAQTTIGRQKVDQFPSNAWGGSIYGLTWLPADYHNNNNTYPLIIFLHGSGEAGSGVNGLYSLLNYALPQKIAQGWDPQAVNPADGQNYQFIVVSPQAPQWSCNYSMLSSIVPDIMAKYRVDPSRVYVTGLSAGGAGTWACVTNGSTFAQKFAAVVPVSAAGTNTSAESAQLPLVGGTYGAKVWSICGIGDSFWTLATSYTSTINSANPAPSVPAVATGLSGGHDAGVWNTTYDPSWRSNAHNKNVYEWMLQYKRGTSTAPAPLPTTNYVSIPGKVEAEAHAAQSGTQLEGTSDAGGGQNVGYIDPSDWMDYNISVATAGTYTLSLRVASGAAGGTLQVRKPDGTVLSTVSIPSTGGWQAWQSVSTSITLAAGQQSLRLISTGGGWNINYLEFAAGATTAPAPTPSTAIALPGKVEAEAFSSQSGTQNEGTSDAGGGQNVGYIDNGDWMDYSVNPTQAGTYTVSLRVASPSSGGSLQLRKSDGSVLTTVSIPNTGGYQSWQSVTATLYLNQGTQTIRLHSSSSNWNINYLNFTLGGTTTTPTPTPTPPSGTQRIEAEAYTAQSGTQKEGTQDSGGGENLGYIDNGDWMEYSVNVAQSATYTVSFRVASQQWGGQLQLRKADGSVLATVAVPYTSGWQTWQSVTASIYLNQGVQTLRIQSTQPANWNINYFELTQGSGGTTTTPAPTPSAGYTALPGKVEAESFSAQSGIQTEGTQDNGGGQNVGYIDYLDWMEYKVSPASAATYTLSLRIATPNNNAQLQLRKADGTVLTTVSLPNTGGYQSWQSVNVSVSLPGGDQTVRVVSTGGGSFNINYLEFAAPSASLTQSTPGVETLSDAISVSQPLEVFPNPIETNFQLKINNTLTGALKVEMINMQGVSIKTFNLQKSSAATSQFYLSASELPQGQYILKATMQNWEKTVNVMKN